MKETILIQGAMESEICIYLSKLSDKKEYDIDGYRFYTGKIEGRNVVVSNTLMGKVNAGIATYIGISKFKPGIVVNSGIAGAHDENLEIGNIVIGKEVYNIDTIVNYGANGLKSIDLKSDSNSISSEKKQFEAYKIELAGGKGITKFFKSSDLLVEKALKMEYTKAKIVSGKLATSDGWLKDKAEILKMRDFFQSDSEDMESAAVAQVCTSFDIPFVCIRVISNSEFNDLGFHEEVANICQDFVIEYIKEL